MRVLVRKDNREHEVSLVGIGDGKYEGRIQVLDGGDYSYKSSANYKGRPVGADSGKFSVEPFNLEYQATQMKLDVLRQIALRSGGLVVPADSLHILAEKLDFPPRRQEQANEWELWNKLAILLIAIACLTLEWFIRKTERDAVTTQELLKKIGEFALKNKIEVYAVGAMFGISF